MSKSTLVQLPLPFTWPRLNNCKMYKEWCTTHMRLGLMCRQPGAKDELSAGFRYLRLFELHRA